MAVHFPGLTPCDVPGCRTLVEPHVARCPDCARRHGRSPKAQGEAGQAPSEPKAPIEKTPGHRPDQPPRQTEPIPAKPSGQLVPCIGPFGRHDCDQLVRRDGKVKRCAKCQRVFDRMRIDGERTEPWQRQLQRLKDRGMVR
jgi:hypothetical protein